MNNGYTWRHNWFLEDLFFSSSHYEDQYCDDISSYIRTHHWSFESLILFLNDYFPETLNINFLLYILPNFM